MWGVPIRSNEYFDIAVYQGIIGDSTEWRLEHKSCPKFLLVMMHLQAAFGGLDWGGVTELEKPQIECFNQWKYVGQVNELQAFCRKGQTVCLIKEKEKYLAYMGALTEQLFDETVKEFKLSGIEFEEA